MSGSLAYKSYRMKETFCQMYASAGLGVRRPAAFIFADARRVNRLSAFPVAQFYWTEESQESPLLFTYFLESCVFRPVGSDIAC